MTDEDNKRVLAQGLVSERLPKKSKVDGENDKGADSVKSSARPKSEDPVPFWSGLWKDIQTGGRGRWVVKDLQLKQNALEHIIQGSGKDGPLKILCPLAGNDLFLHNAWSQGHSVTGIDLVPAAVDEMRKQFGPDDTHWTNETNGRTDGMAVWKHKSGRATLYQGDIATDLEELSTSFDAAYDKDSFGAIPPKLRRTYCDRLAQYIIESGVVYIEVVNKADDSPTRYDGPPYHLEKQDLMEGSNFGKDFEHVQSLGKLYDKETPGQVQMGHILKRLPTNADE